jgi:hypothetical protein
LGFSFGAFFVQKDTYLKWGFDGFDRLCVLVCFVSILEMLVSRVLSRLCSRERCFFTVHLAQMLTGLRSGCLSGSDTKRSAAL